MVLFGATGDLAQRLVVPALYNLIEAGSLPKGFRLLGVARREDSVEGWREQLFKSLKAFSKGGEALRGESIDEATWKALGERMSFIQGDLTQPDVYRDIKAALDAPDMSRATKGNALFYLAVADPLFGPIVDRLSEAGLVQQPAGHADEPRFWRRVVVEKPFGHDLDSGRALNARLAKALGEDQIYRIDHFLGKDTVQSIMAFRFANGLFEPIWNRDRIDHVQITAAETLGVEKRGEFYEQTGALRDMVPNHLLSLLCLVAMEPPTGFGAAAIREKKADVLAAMPPADPAKAVRGQYGKGRIAGRAACAYRAEPDVSPRSGAETYAALALEVDNWRWAGVPFFLRTGKHLERRVTEIAIAFKPAPYSAFQDTPVEALKPNWLVIRIAPDEGVWLRFEIKRRGPRVALAPVTMRFNYDDWFPAQANVGYEVLLYDAMIGDPTLFIRADMAEQGWRIVQPILDAWAAHKPDFPNYASGADGPLAASDLISGGGGRQWRPLSGPDA
jgi:glucose-6-phosphate 1-dehydrogenase